MFFQSVNLGEMVMCLEDLINYFAQPDDDMGKLSLSEKKDAELSELQIVAFQSTKRSRTASARCATVKICSRRRAC